jgi:hypothetical protein
VSASAAYANFANTADVILACIPFQMHSAFRPLVSNRVSCFKFVHLALGIYRLLHHYLRESLWFYAACMLQFVQLSSFTNLTAFQVLLCISRPLFPLLKTYSAASEMLDC